MKKQTLILLTMLAVLWVVLVPAQVPRQKAPPIPLDPAEAAWRDYIKADKELNAAYQMLAESLGDARKEAKTKLQAAQLAWIKYRDLTVASEMALRGEGPQADLAHHRSLETLTRERTARLKGMIKELLSQSADSGKP